MCKQRQGTEGGSTTEGLYNLPSKCGGNCAKCPFQQKVIEEVADILGGNNSVNTLSLTIDNGGNKSL